MKITKILLTTMVLTSIATSAFASNPVNVISGDGKKLLQHSVIEMFIDGIRRLVHE